MISRQVPSVVRILSFMTIAVDESHGSGPTIFGRLYLFNNNFVRHIIWFYNASSQSNISLTMISDRRISRLPPFCSERN